MQRSDVKTLEQVSMVDWQSGPTLWRSSMGVNKYQQFAVPGAEVGDWTVDGWYRCRLVCKLEWRRTTIYPHPPHYHPPTPTYHHHHHPPPPTHTHVHLVGEGQSSKRAHLRPVIESPHHHHHHIPIQSSGRNQQGQHFTSTEPSSLQAPRKPRKPLP